MYLAVCDKIVIDSVLCLHFSLFLQPLLERLDSVAASKGLTSGQPNIIAFPPDFEPIACKPLFFDLALNHIDYPDLDQRVEKQQGGLTGFVKGLFWGGK